MLKPTGSRLFRFLLLLLTRLRWSVARIALALRLQFASVWRFILTLARRSGRSRIRFHANHVPTVDTSTIGSEPAEVKEKNRTTLAALPVQRTANWRDVLSGYLALNSSFEFKFEPLPATPESGSERYIPRKVIQGFERLEIPAGQEELLSALPQLPDDWTRHVHPEGNLLFYHKKLRVFTESDISDHRKCKEVMFHATTLIKTAIETDGVTMDELTEIVLNVDSSQQCHYYFVDHTHRLLFWVHPMKPQRCDTDLRGIRYLVESQYWYAPTGLSGTLTPYVAFDMVSRLHCEYYPNNRTLPEEVFGNLRGMLNQAQTDMITTDSSSSPFAKDELDAILNIVNSIKVDGNILDPYNIWIIARLMTYFTESQFLNFWGQPCVRLNADTPLFGKQTWNRTTVFKVVNVLLFGSPDDHAVRLQRTWVDGDVLPRRWKDFAAEFKSELTQYPIFSTVMLAVNIAFLAVPGVVAAGSSASSTQIMLYCSVVSAIASIVFYYILLRAYSDARFLDTNLAAALMRTLSQRKWGMAGLTVVHSLPFGCLVWSIVLFCVGLAIQIFGPRERSTVTTLGVECLVFVLFGSMSQLIMRLSFWDDDGDEGVDASASRPQDYHIVTLSRVRSGVAHFTAR